MSLLSVIGERNRGGGGPPPAGATILSETFSATAIGFTAASHTFALTIDAATTVIAVLLHRRYANASANCPTTGVTIDGVSATLLVTCTPAAGNNQVSAEVWVLNASIPSGTVNVVVSFSGTTITGSQAQCRALCLSGVTTTLANWRAASTSTAATAATTTTSTITPTTADGLLIGSGASRNVNASGGQAAATLSGVTKIGGNDNTAGSSDTLSMMTVWGWAVCSSTSSQSFVMTKGSERAASLFFHAPDL